MSKAGQSNNGGGGNPNGSSFLSDLQNVVQKSTPENKVFLDQRLQSLLGAAQKIPKFTFSQGATDGMTPGLNKTAADLGIGATESLLNTPANLITGSTKIGEQVGNVMTGNPINVRKGIEGAGETGSALLNGSMVQGAMSPFSNEAASARFRAANPSTSEGFFKTADGRLYDPLNGQFAHTADVIPQEAIQQAKTSHMIPIKQGDKVIGEFDIGRSFQDYDPKIVKKFVKFLQDTKK